METKQVTAVSGKKEPGTEREDNENIDLEGFLFFRDLFSVLRIKII